MTPSATSARAPMKQSSSMTTGPRLQRLEHAADPGAAGDVAALADLRAGADRRPGVDHRGLVHIGAEIDEGRHQHDARRDIGGAAHDRARHGAEAGSTETVVAPAGELRRHLVPPIGAARSARDRRHVVQAERQEHGLLQPFVDGPFAVVLLLGDAHRAGIEQLERGLHRLAHFAARGNADRLPIVECSLDNPAKLGNVGHEMLRKNARTL